MCGLEFDASVGGVGDLGSGSPTFSQKDLLARIFTEQGASQKLGVTITDAL